jgi:hypothetical protein
MKTPLKARLRAVHDDLSTLQNQVNSKQIAHMAIADRLDDTRRDLSLILDEMEDGHE